MGELAEVVEVAPFGGRIPTVPDVLVAGVPHAAIFSNRVLYIYDSGRSAISHPAA